MSPKMSDLYYTDWQAWLGMSLIWKPIAVKYEM